MKKLFAAALLTSALAAPAFAQNTPFYVGALASSDMIGVLGGYQINQMFSVEGHYAKIDVPNVNVGWVSYNNDAYQVGASLVAMLPWKIPHVPALTFFAKGGVERTSVKTTVNYPWWWGMPSTSATSNSTELVLGGGAQYDVTRNFAVRLGANLINGHNDLYANAILKF